MLSRKPPSTFHRVWFDLGSTIYVLHAFQKKSKTGKKTSQQDVDLIKRRYRDAQELARHAQEEN
jgi:phage-related protein